MTNQTRTAQIAGAGFAGLTAATALAQKGWDVTVHEKAAELRALGAGIVLWNNSLRVLEALGLLGELERRSMVSPFYETRIHNETVSREDFGGLPWRSLTRKNLHDVLLEGAMAAGVKIRVDSEVVSADPAGFITLSDGTTVTADLVIGADGVRSNVRDSIGFEQERTTSRDGITRLIVPRNKDLLGPGDWDNVIDFWNFEPRVLRVLYVPCNDDELYIALMAPADDAEGSAVPINLDVWVENFPHLEPILIPAAKIHGRYDRYQTNLLSSWTNGRVALIGDAAHAMCPALAQGAGTAMSNAYTVAQAATQSSVSDLADALVDWEKSERGVTDRCQSRSAFFAETRSMSKGNQFTQEMLETAIYDPTSAKV